MRTLHAPFVKTAIAAGFVFASMALSTDVANADGLDWDAVAQCESGGDWSADTGNGFYGGLQFRPTTWAENGGVGSPAAASRQEQIDVADRVLQTQGPGAWPKCGGASGLSPAVWAALTGRLRATVNQVISLFLPRW